MCKLTCCRNRLLLLFFLLFCHHLCHASFPHDVPSRTMQHNNRFGIEAAKPMAPMPEGMLIVTLLGRHQQLPGTSPYIFLRRTQLTTTPQCALTHRDLNGRQRPPWCQLPTLMHTTVTQYVGWLSYAAAPGVGHHGSRGTMVTAKVGGARFS